MSKRKPHNQDAGATRPGVHLDQRNELMNTHKPKPTATARTRANTTPREAPHIEKGIPIPSPKQGGVAASTLSQMGVMDSVVIHRSQIQNWRIAARKLNLKIITRATSPTHSRIWKILP